jgi:hypothetical protein
MGKINELENYDANEHIHRYAVWTAARASQRGFATTELIGKAIENVNLKEEVLELEKRKEISATDFDKWHEIICEKVESELKLELAKKNSLREVSFGRAAKIVNIYLKTFLVIRLCGSDNKLVILIHPPIDRILLSNLIAEKKLGKERMGNWTTMRKEQYSQIINNLRVNFHVLWKVEVYWKAHDEE